MNVRDSMDPLHPARGCSSWSTSTANTLLKVGQSLASLLYVQTPLLSTLLEVENCIPFSAVVVRSISSSLSNFMFTWHVHML